MPSAPETSFFESLRKGYKAVSKSIIGMLHNKEGNLVTNKEQTWINGKQSKIDEIDIKESTREQGVELKTKSLEIENNMVQTYTKSSIKLRNKCRFEPLSMISMILLSILVSTAGAGKIKSEDKNVIPRREPTWANPRTETRKHEELLISAFDCIQQPA